MKRGILLRQKVPKDVERITFDTYEDIDDMWMLLMYHTCKKLEIDKFESWNYGGFRHNYLKSDFLERWMLDFRQCRNDNRDSVSIIFNKGGFAHHIPVMEHFNRAFKIYWGSKRFCPTHVPDPTNYNLVLASTEEDKEFIENEGYKSELFIKPACDSIFFPVNIPKKYDIVFIANAPQKKIKGHKWLFNKLNSSNLNILQIGHLDNEVKKWAKSNKLNIEFTGWIPRKKIPRYACQAKIGIVASTNYESCPRVIPEYLAMALPIIVRDTVRVNSLYVNEHTGMFVSDYDIVESIKYMKDNISDFSPYQYYRETLNIDKASTHLSNIIKGLM